jgi:GTP cyclohydrolase I
MSKEFERYLASKQPQQELFHNAAQLLLRATGVDEKAPGLSRTPERYAKAMGYLLSGYNDQPKDVVGKGIFPSETQGLVAVKNIEFFSLCEHHMLPFWGTVSVAYYPKTSIIGLSKIPRLVELYARRLQVQERLTNQIAEALLELLDPRAVMVSASGQHLCMMMRGVEKQLSSTVTETHKGITNLNDVERERLFQVAGVRP